MEDFSASTSFNPEDSLAGRGKRLAAVILDCILIYLPFLIVMPFEDYIESDGVSFFLGLYVLVLIIVQLVLLSIHGQTLGKMILKIKIVRVDTGANGGFVTNVLIRGFVNSLIGIIPIYPLIDVLFIFADDRRCVHDKLAGTKVVNC